jgi:microcystin-dependent protein
MSCSNCYNGCAEIVSDKCVKYTGVDIPVLGIEKGDSLLVVEQSIIQFLTSTLDGTGIKLDIDSEIICEIVNKYLPVCAECTTLNALDLFKALIKAACDIQEQVDAIVAQLAALEGDYNVECLEDVTSGSGTHNILQATITKLCEVDVDLAALATDVDTNYVKLADLDDLIQAYLDSTSPTTQQNAKMVPYTVVEYYGPLSNFDSSGAGIASLGWDKIYICNGSNGTPDKRGRIGVGVTTGVPGGAMSSVVDPAVPGNPTYSLYSVNGTNNVTLTSSQMPSHIHANILTFNDPGHSHLTVVNQQVGGGGFPTSSNTMAASYASGTSSQNYDLKGVTATPDVSLTNSKTTGITATLANASQGGSQAHTNIPPVLATNYIIYLP